MELGVRAPQPYAGVISPGRTRTSSPRRSGLGDGAVAGEPTPRSSVRRVVDPAGEVAGVTSVHGRESPSRDGGGG